MQASHFLESMEKTRCGRKGSIVDRYGQSVQHQHNFKNVFSERISVSTFSSFHQDALFSPCHFGINWGFLIQNFKTWHGSKLVLCCSPVLVAPVSYRYLYRLLEYKGWFLLKRRNRLKQAMGSFPHEQPPSALSNISTLVCFSVMFEVTQTHLFFSFLNAVVLNK